MSWHPAEEDLVLYCHGDAPPPVRLDVETHLAACPTCRAARDGIRDTLRAADEADVPDPGPGFEHRLWSRVSAAIAVGGPVAPVMPSSVRVLVPAGVWLAAAVVASATALLWLHDSGSTGRSVPGPSVESTAVQERVLLTALDDHFTRTELLLVELLNAPVDPAPGLEFERAVADDLVASGRLYRETALQTGEAHVSAVLEDLETVLIEVARGPERLEPMELDLLRLQIDEYGLLFKVRAVGDRIRGRRETIAPVRHE